MISSMTGFGKGSVQSDNFNIEAEIRSVNSRYLEVSLKIPRNLQSKELELREFIRGKLKRGKITVNIQIKKNGIDENKPVLNPESIAYALNLLEQVKEQSGLEEKISLNHILAFQDIFFAEAAEESEQEFILVKNALDEAINDLVRMRTQEGEELAKDIKARVLSIEEAVNSIEGINKSSTQEFFEKIKERAKQLFGDIKLYSDRLELELALLVDKSDVTEECVRLHSHVKFFLENLKSGVEIGRKLNFLCQEINREANTIGSKALSTEISHQTVFIKEELEKIREQIQNIE